MEITSTDFIHSKKNTGITLIPSKIILIQRIHNTKIKQITT